MSQTQTSMPNATKSFAVAGAKSPDPNANEASRAMQALIREIGHGGLAEVSACAGDGWVLLEGQVASFYLKQLAQEAVRPLAIGIEIRNEIHVR